MTNTKSFLTSKTLWFNFLLLVALVLNDVAKLDFITNKDVFVSLAAGVNLFLRLMTDKPVEMKLPNAK